MVNNLRQEAIEEIKLLRIEGEKRHDGGLFKFRDMILNDKINHRDFFLLVRYIKSKFNITDEELNDAIRGK